MSFHVLVTSTVNLHLKVANATNNNQQRHQKQQHYNTDGPADDFVYGSPAPSSFLSPRPPGSLIDGLVLRRVGLESDLNLE